MPHVQIILFVIMFPRFICQNEFHPLSTNSRGAVALRGESACPVNRRSLVQIRAVPHFQIILWFIIMFTLFVFQNDFHPLSDFESGSVA